MKLNRKWLMAGALAAAVAMIAYTVLRELFGFSLGAGFEKTFFDVIFVIAIALVLINKKMADDEKKAEKSSGEVEKQ
jgi:uncharacterized membrane protein